jgi:hypothetical protein
MSLDFQEKSTRKSKLVETSENLSFSEMTDREKPVSNSPPFSDNEAKLEQSKLTELLSEAAEQSDKDKTLQKSCLTCLDFLKDFIPENYGKTQGTLLSHARSMGILLLFMAALFIPIIAYRCYTDGITYLMGLGWLVASFLPFISSAIPAISLLGNWLDRRNNYRPAEICHQIMLTISYCFPQTSVFRYYAGLELAEFYLSLGKPGKALAILKNLSGAKDADDLGLGAITLAMKANCLAQLGQIQPAWSLANETLNSFESYSLDEASRKRVEGKLRTFIADTFFLCGKYKEALAQNQKALETRISFKTESKENLALIASQISRCYLCLNNGNAAQTWAAIAMTATNSKTGGKKAKVKALLAAGQAELKNAEIDASNKLDTALQILQSMKPYHCDLGEVQHSLGLLHAQKSEWSKAEEHFSKAVDLRSSILAADHPLTKHSMEMHLTALKELGDTKAAEILETHITTKTPIELESLEEARNKPPASRKVHPFKTMGPKEKILIFLGLCALPNLAYAGFRAADGFAWFLGCVFLAFGIGVLIMNSQKALKIKALLKKSANFQRLDTTVSFRQLTDANTDFHSYVAKLGAPYNREIFVKDELGSLRHQMKFHATNRDCIIACEGGEPVLIETELGPVELSLTSNKTHLPLSEQHKKAANHYEYRNNVALGTVLSIILIIPLFFIYTFNPKQEQLPPNLTAYEYYRYGASRLADDQKYHSYHNLKTIEKSLKKAAEQDNGFIGNQANRCLKNELPTKIPTSEILDQYQLVVGGKYSTQENIENLNNCIEAEPKFDWAYSELANQYIDAKNLKAAQTNLKQAQALNPKSLNYLFVRARLEKAQSNKDASWKTLIQAQELDPFLPQTYLELLKLLIP